MSALPMPSRTWTELVKKRKKQSARFRIVLVVRGKTVVKEYSDEEEFRRWLGTFKLQKERQTDNAIESIRHEMRFQ